PGSRGPARIARRIIAHRRGRSRRSSTQSTHAAASTSSNLDRKGGGTYLTDRRRTTTVWTRQGGQGGLHGPGSCRLPGVAQRPCCPPSLSPPLLLARIAHRARDRPSSAFSAATERASPVVEYRRRRTQCHRLHLPGPVRAIQ